MTRDFKHEKLPFSTFGFLPSRLLTRGVEESFFSKEKSYILKPRLKAEIGHLVLTF